MGNSITSACRLTGTGSRVLVPAVLWHPGASAQGYPAKPIRIIASAAAGAPPDFVARTMAQYLTTALGQQVIVENRPGAGGTIATAAAARSPADGYTLLLASTSNLSISPSLYANPGYDPVTSFAPISLLATAPFLVMVHPSLPAKSLKELIALAKAKPGELNYGSAGSGSPLHIGAEMLKTAAGVQLVHVPYKGPTAAVIDLLSGRIQVLVEQLYPVAQHIQSGRSGPSRSRARSGIRSFPELPTAAEAGLPGYEVVAWMGLVAPRGTCGRCHQAPERGTGESAPDAGNARRAFQPGPATGRQLAGGVRRIHRDRVRPVVARGQDVRREGRLAASGTSACGPTSLCRPPARHRGCRCDSVCAAGCGSSERPRQVEAYATQRLCAPSRTTVPETEAGAHPHKPGPLLRPSTRTPPEG